MALLRHTLAEPVGSAEPVRAQEYRPNVTAREEDRDLAYEQFPAMNRTFYSSKLGPEAYLNARLRSLLVGTSGSPLIAQASSEGFEIGEMKVAYAEKEWSEEEAADFLATESAVLLHHAGETLLRLYFAHAGLPPCPWLETARLRSFSLFKRKVTELLESLATPDVQASIMQVFTGRGDVAQRPNAISEEAWFAQREGLVDLLAATGRVLLGDSNLYNAAKHGLAVFPAEIGISIGSPDPETEIDLSMDGRALQYLQVVQHGDRKFWEERSAWVFAESNLSMTYIIARQISSLMSVAKARYVPGTEGYSVLPINAEMVRVASTAGWPNKSILFQSFGQQLLYYAASDQADPTKE